MILRYFTEKFRDFHLYIFRNQLLENQDFSIAIGKFRDKMQQNGFCTVKSHNAEIMLHLSELFIITKKLTLLEFKFNQFSNLNFSRRL